MMRLAAILACCGLMGVFVWFAHWTVYGFGREFGIGFGLGSTFMALVSGSYIYLRYGE